MLRLSIIVPVYNVASYVKRCIESLFHQNIPVEEYEVIIVNDGSTDNSLAIVEELAHHKQNITVISQENQGLSGARNTGILNAQGRYIWFVDSDDYIKDNCLNQLLEEADCFNVDAYAFLLEVRSIDSITVGGRQPLVFNKIITGKKAMLSGFSPCSSCCYLFQREFLKSKQLLFTLGITHEDVDFSVRFMVAADKVVFTNHKPYIYDFNPTSLSNSKSALCQRKNLLDNLVLSSLIKKVAYLQNDKQIERCLIKRSNSIVFGLFWSVIKDKSKHSYINEIIQLAKKEKLYPIHKPLLSWKSSALASLLNFEWIVRIVCKTNL